MNRRFRSGIVLVCLLTLSGGVAFSQTIQLNPATRYQTITGWEATAQACQISPAFNLFKDQLFDLAVNDLGINRVRLEIRSWAENSQDYVQLYETGQIDYATWRAVRYATVNDNADPFSINWSGYKFTGLDDTIDKVVNPLRQQMADRGERLFVNLNYVAFTGQIGAGLDYCHDDSPEEYAEFVEATYLHMQQKYGWVPDTWEVILEPDNTSFWRGQQIGQAIVSAAQRLESHGFTPRFVAPSTTSMANAVSYYDGLKQVPGALQYLQEICYHRYSGVSDANLQALALRGQQDGKDTAMLEHMGSGYQDLHKDLKMGNVSAWSQFTLAFNIPDDGGHYYIIDDSNPANPTITMAPRTPYLAQYFRYVREGAVRVEATTGNAAFDPVAFINANGYYVAVVKATGGGAFTIAGLPEGQYGVSFTTAGAYDVQLPQVDLAAGEWLSASIPAAGVLTVYQVPEPTTLALLAFAAAPLLRRRTGKRS